MTHDPVRSQLVVYGGVGRNDTWELASTGTAWVNRTSGGSNPSARDDPAFVFDSTQARALLVGGSGTLNQLWSWDGTSWLRRADAPVPTTASTFDGTRQQLISIAFDDVVWKWDGTSWARTTPPLRTLPALAYDPVRQTTLMFGGGVEGATHYNDTWSWDGTRWTRLNTPASPGPRRGATMVYDRARQRMVLYGGEDTYVTTTARGDTWEFDGATWIQRQPTISPGDLFGYLMAYDEVRGVTMLHGGTNGFLDRYSTWEWDGQVWTVRATGVTGYTLAWDPTRNAMLLAGLAATSAWSGSSWVTVPGSNGNWAAGVTDSFRNRVVSFSSPETFEWNGSSWSSVTHASRPSNEEASIAYDAARRRVVLVQKSQDGLRTDVWEYLTP